MLLFFGHHRCASSWINDIFGAVSRELRLRYLTAHHPRIFDNDLQRFAEQQSLDVIAYTNADYQYVERLRDFRAFHVVRDPRDVSVSAYFSHLYSHRVDQEWPELEDRRRELQELGKDEGLLREMEGLSWEFKCMRDWNYAHPHILEVKAEKLTENPYNHFLEVFRFLGLLDEQRFSLTRRMVYTLCRGVRAAESLGGGRISLPGAPKRLPAERILGIVWENDFSRKAGGRERGREEPRSHYRKGVSGDWRNHFKAQHVAYFEEHYGDVLQKLSYEDGSGWG